MKNFNMELSEEYRQTPEEIMDNFYKNLPEAGKDNIIRISLGQLRELKEKGVSVENFLNHLCQKHGLLLHGSIHAIAGNELSPNQEKIFATNESAIAILKSIYSNKSELEYPYFLNKDNPLVLKIHASSNDKSISKENGFIYIISQDGFKNEPEGSWQFIKSADRSKINIVFETEKSDFKYPIEFLDNETKKE